MLNLAALREYACVKSPQLQIPPSTLLTYNDQCIAIFDAFPKAKYHFLVLPRYPLPSALDGSESKLKGSVCRLDDLDSLSTVMLRTGQARREILDAMINMAKEVEEMILDEMVKTDGFTWGIDMGFHAVPSMQHVHLHVISDDRISPSLKTKKHYNSFRPDLGFLVPPHEVQQSLDEGDDAVRRLVKGLAARHSLLNEPLMCLRCGETFNQMPKLKAHLEEEWQMARRKATKTKR